MVIVEKLSNEKLNKSFNQIEYRNLYKQIENDIRVNFKEWTKEGLINIIKNIGYNIKLCRNKKLEIFEEACLDILRTIYLYSKDNEVLIEVIRVHPILNNYIL